MSRFKVKGINDERDACECCGKTGLKRVVWIEDTETLEVRAFGTTCAASPRHAFGLGREIKAAVRRHDAELSLARNAARNAAIVSACKMASETFEGERRQGRFGAMIPVDLEAFEAHKSAIVSEALAAFSE